MRDLERIFENLKAATKKDYMSSTVTELIVDLSYRAFDYLNSECEVIGVESKVPTKQYSCYMTKSGRLSRPLNRNLWSTDKNQFSDYCRLFMNEDFRGHSEDTLSRILYQIAFAFPCYIDVTKVNDKKTPGTYFEFVIGIYLRSE